MPTRVPALERLEPRDVPAHLYAVGTDPVRVMLCALHQHDAPVIDTDAEGLLRSHKATGSVLIAVR